MQIMLIARLAAFEVAGGSICVMGSEGITGGWSSSSDIAGGTHNLSRLKSRLTELIILFMHDALLRTHLSFAGVEGNPSLVCVLKIFMATSSPHSNNIVISLLIGMSKNTPNSSRYPEQYCCDKDQKKP